MLLFLRNAVCAFSITSSLVFFLLLLHPSLYKTVSDLIVAADHGEVDVVKEILANNFEDVNITDKYGDTALIWASIRGNLEVVKILIESMAELNIRDFWGHSALTYASAHGKLKVVDLLIEKGAFLHIEITPGFNAISAAMEYNHFDVVERLVFAGVEVLSEKNEKLTEILNKHRKHVHQSITSFVRFSTFVRRLPRKEPGESCTEITLGSLFFETLD